LEETDDGIWSVYFYDVLLARLMNGPINCTLALRKTVDRCATDVPGLICYSSARSIHLPLANIAFQPTRRNRGDFTTRNQLKCHTDL